MRCGPEDIFDVCRVMLDPVIIDSTMPDNTTPYGAKEMEALLRIESCIFLMPNEYTVIILTPISGSIVGVHINTSMQGRGEIAIKAANDAIEWIKQNTSYTHLLSYIPSLYMNVIKFAEKVGFVLQSTIPSSYLKHGVQYDTMILCRSL